MNLFASTKQCIAAGLFLVLISTNTDALAADTTVAERLDAELTIRLEGLPVKDALGQLAASTDVKFFTVEKPFDALPYGENTKVSIVLEVATVRMGLEAICNQLAMNFVTDNDGVTVMPSQALLRIERTATWDELDTLAQLRTSHWPDADAIKRIVANRLRFAGIKGDFESNWNKLQSAINPNRESPIDDALTEGCEALDWTWFPMKKQIVVLPKKDQIARQLERIVSVKHYGVPFRNVLEDLARLAGVGIEIQRDANVSIPDARNNENFTLVAEGISVREALMQLMMTAELDHVIEIRDDKVVLVHSDRAGPPARWRRRNDPIVGAVHVPGQDGTFTYDWFIRESDLTLEENIKREMQVKEAIEAMKKDLAKISLPEDE